jgi:hypothetical protein
VTILHKKYSKDAGFGIFIFKFSGKALDPPPNTDRRAKSLPLLVTL